VGALMEYEDDLVEFGGLCGLDLSAWLKLSD
jgi:hypothetical protein